MVGAYPFERPEDKNDNQKLQKMIQVERCHQTIPFVESQTRLHTLLNHTFTIPTLLES